MGGKDDKPVIGYHYRVAYHAGLGRGPIDAFLEFRAADKTAWDGSEQTWFLGGEAIRKRGSGFPINEETLAATGPLTSSGSIYIGKPNLFGGSKDQGGIEGPMDIMFGEADQMPNPYLQEVFGDQTVAWRGLATVAFCGGRYGAMNPMPQKPAYKVRKILKGWDGDWGEDPCWYPERAEIGEVLARTPVVGEWPWPVRDVDYVVIGASQEVAGSLTQFQGWWHGNVDSYRITKGVARYTTAEYAVPTGPFGNETTDPHYDDVVLLLRMNGADGSTDIVDEKGHAVEAMGGAALTTARSRFGGSSAAFNGLTSWLKVTLGADANLGSGPWTMDAWVWLDSYWHDDYSRALFGYGPISVGSNDTVWYLAGQDWTFLQLEDGAARAPYIAQNVGPRMQLGRWAFVSICWDGSQYWLHMDGKLLTGVIQPFAMNPAHALYYVRTDGEKGREPYASINEDSLRAAADRLYAEHFGLCWQYDPKQDSPDAWCEHICRIIGGSFSRSLIDGQWYLDLARGDYNVDSLPIVGDDDILEFRELPTTLDRAVNSVSVRYFDPERKEKIITPAVRALGLIRMFGEIHQTLDFPEIPTADLATRVAERELRAYVTPTRAFELVTTPRTRGIRNNQYFRLQSPRRGIADMVCIMGEQDSGTLRSGALRRKVTQDVYALPATTYVEVEQGVDTRPPQTPLPVVHGRVLEAPYIVVAAATPRAELAAVPDDAGYLLAVAADPGQHLDYRVVVDAGAGFMAGGSSRWCATGLIVEPAGFTETGFTIASGRHLAAAELGAAVLWGDEICRLDALDVVAGTITLGRGCADTVAQRHLAGERIWILTDAARGPGEYTDGEEVVAKLITRTATAELPLSEAPALPLEFASRQARPYPPAGLLINGTAEPGDVAGEVVLSWQHRDRVLQADQLVDQSVASIGPEPGTTYTVRWYLDEELQHTDSGITGNTVTYEPAGDGLLRLELVAVRGGLESWQAQVRTISLGSVLLTEDDEPITTEDDEPIFLE